MRRTTLLLTLMTAAMLLAGGVDLISGFGPGGTAVAEARPADETLKGIFAMRVGDTFSEGSHATHKVEYVLTDEGGKTTQLSLPEQVAESAGSDLSLVGKQVTVEGTSTPGGKLEVQQIRRAPSEQDGATSAFVAGAPVKGSQPVATILCRFADSTNVTPHGRKWFDTQVSGTSEPSADHFWRQVSFNKINLSGSQVFGWYNLPGPRSAYVTGGGFLMLDRVAQDCTKVANADVFFPNYTTISMMFNGDFGAAYGGYQTLTRDGQTKTYGATWMPRRGYENIGILEHELGHSYGLPHSGGPYGHPYDSLWDVMSSAGISDGIDLENGTCYPDPTYGCKAMGTISAHKERLGWIPAARKYTAAAGSDQTITIHRLGAPASSNYLMAKVPIEGCSTRFYTVEARRPVGYDRYAAGDAIVIHKVDTTYASGFSEIAHVVDPDGNRDPNDAGAQWLPGETFTDTENHISIKVTRATSTGYRVRIQRGLTSTETSIVEENDRSHAQYGDWHFWQFDALSGGYDAFSEVKDSALSFTFTGTNVTWKTLKSPFSGITAVYLDGVRQDLDPSTQNTIEDFDGYSGADEFDVTGFSKEGLADTTHTLELVVTGQKNAFSEGTYTDVDRFLVDGTTFEEDSPGVAYDGWAEVSDASASGGTYHEGTSTSKAALFYYFRGPQVDLITAKGPSHGTAKVGIVDARSKALVSTRNVDLNSATNEWQHKVSITGLDPCKSYYLSVVSSDGKPVVVDAIGATLDQTIEDPPLVGASGAATSFEAARPEPLKVIE